MARGRLTAPDLGTTAHMTGDDARAGFELQRFASGEDGLLEVEGEWTNVRGMRFVRPALVVHQDGAERTLLATLDHKPWNPEGRPWRAAFPWDGGELDPRRAELAVAPSIVVPLAGERGEPVRADPGDVLRDRLHEAQERIHHLESEVAFLRREREDLGTAGDRVRERAAAERDAARAALQAAERERDEARRDAGRDREEAKRLVAAEREEVRRARDRLVAERDAARAERDAAHALESKAYEQRDEALARPAGVIDAGEIAQRLRTERRERESPGADWAARTAAIVAVLLLLVLLITLFKAL
jgi:hypothetical protein